MHIYIYMIGHMTISNQTKPTKQFSPTILLGQPKIDSCLQKAMAAAYSVSENMAMYHHTQVWCCQSSQTDILGTQAKSVHRLWVDLQHYRYDGSSEFRITCIMAFLNSELPGSPHNFRHIQGTTNKAMRSILSQRLCLLTPAKFQLGKLRSKKNTQLKTKDQQTTTETWP